MVKQNILILGAGFGGLTVLNRLSRSLKNRDDIRITLIDQHNFFLFSPLLHEAAVGVLLPENILTPVRKLIRNKNADFIPANVASIDLAARRVTTSVGVHDYDYLVLALGGITDYSTVANIKDSSSLLILKTIQDATAIKNRIIDVFEKAGLTKDPEEIKRLLTFVILGGGYTGVQFIAGLSDAIHKYLRVGYRHINPDNIKIILIESEDRIIRDLPVKYSRYITRHLQKRRIEVKLNSRVTRIDNNQISINDQETIEFQTLIYVPGVVANPLIPALGVPTGDRDRAVINEYMEIEGFPGVYAVGDCANYQDPVTGQVARPRAHVAVRQARTVARNLIAVLKGREKTKYIYSDTEEIMSLGKSNALLRVRRFWIRGIPALLTWVMSYSLLAFGRKNRLKIAIDWILSWLYGPDFIIIKPDK